MQTLSRSFCLALAMLAGASSSPLRAQCQIDELVGSGYPLGVGESPYSLATSGDSLAVAFGPQTGLPWDSGAYVFVRAGSTWVEQADVKSPMIWGLSQAATLTLDEDTLVFVDGVMDATYVYTRSGATWSAAATLTTPSGYASQAAVALSGSTLAVGLAEMQGWEYDREGQVYVFSGSGSSWVLEATLLPDDPDDASFGRAVALDGDRLFVLLGAGGAATMISGAVYEFQRIGGTWSKVDTIVPPPGATFGKHLAVDGSLLAVGNRDASDEVGAVHVFAEAGGTWVYEATLTSGELPPHIVLSFGRSFDLQGERLIVGNARADHSTPMSGVVYVFERTGGTWVQLKRVYGDDVGEYDFFGSAVAFTGAGEIAVTTNGSGSGDNGKVYLFYDDPGCPAAAFTAQPTSGVAPLAVDFHDLSIGATDGPIWDFGDGSPVVSGVHDLIHTYQESGAYDVSLTVGNAVGTDRTVEPDYIAVQIAAKAVVHTGTGVNPMCFSSTSLPAIGTTWTSQVDATGHPGAAATFVAITLASYGPYGHLGAFGEVLVFPPVIHLDVASVVGGSGQHAIPIPSDPALSGRWVYTQGAVADGFASLCNGIDLQFGY